MARRIAGRETFVSITRVELDDDVLRAPVRVAVG